MDGVARQIWRRTLALAMALLSGLGVPNPGEDPQPVEGPPPADDVSEPTRGLRNGTVVSRNVAPEGISAGDQWTLHLNAPVQVRPEASITVRAGDGPAIMFTRTMAAWEVEGASLVITLGPSADGVPSSVYDGVVVTQLAGIVDDGGRAIGVEQLQDRGLDHNGPELMRDSATCERGERTCTIAFNERVTSASATSLLRYSFSGILEGRSLEAVTLGGDRRTITLHFSGPLRPGDRLRPVGVLGAVIDLHGQASTQPGVHFVR